MFWGYWGYIGATIAKEQALGIQALEQLGLPRGYLHQRAHHSNTGSGATGATLVRAFVDDKTIGTHAMEQLGLPWGYTRQGANHWNTNSDATGATLGLHMPADKSLEYNLWGYWGYILGRALPKSKSL